MKYRILVVGPTPPPYHGCSAMTENLLQSNIPKQFDFVFLDIADRRGISNIGTLEFRNVLLATFHGIKFIYLLIRYNPDLIYLSISQVLWGYLRDLLFLIPARLTNKKILIHLHGGAFQQFYKSMPQPLGSLTRYIFKGQVWTIVLGKCLKSSFSGLIDSESTYIVPNGIRNITYPRNSITTKNGEIHVLYLSNLMESKGFLDLLIIVPEIVKQYPNVYFTFAGEKTHSSEMEKAMSIISRHQIGKFVNLPGVVKGHEKENLLTDADIFVFPPKAQEGQPLVILEAMAASLPVISTNRGAICETILDGITGFAVPPGNTNVLLKRLLLLIEDENLRQKMGREGKRRFHQHYTWQRWVSDMRAIFDEVLHYHSLIRN